MATFPVSNARQRLAEIIEFAQTEAVILERYGSPAAVVISHARYDQLMEALEDLEDIDLYDAAIAESGEPIPWEQVEKDLGWA
ncbi:MAG: type II toxin-antitoxin system Phd/YefM family antitoxin [Ilumatobacteraceae bacterium]